MEIDYSTIAKIAKCPKAYEYDLIGTEPAPVSGALYLGGTFHLVQEVYFKSKLAGVELSKDDLVEVFNNFWYSLEAAQGRPVAWAREVPEDIAELGRTMVKAFYPYAQRIQPLLVEQRLTRNTPYGLVFGKLDLLNTQGEIDDWKTSKWFPYQADVDRELQPTVYNFLLGGLVPFSYYYVMKFKLPVVRIIKTKRCKADLVFFEHSLLPAVVKMIQAGMFPPLGKATGACKWCQHKDYCGEV